MVKTADMYISLQVGQRTNEPRKESQAGFLDSEPLGMRVPASHRSAARVPAAVFPEFFAR